ncbi:DUF485 domain-containing protein [Microbacterium excoecariae]|uniref:DUF485 domain-containing protein n=1 Tax=Microbacterium excoecariae TaxID=2715210 RepID=UPI00140E11D9|nr:DUF485 domain-containing protein [Microbacterium excoecariae]NHI17882.1 DUF485 domain-containing protein [Microbacterium excoecariae]
MTDKNTATTPAGVVDYIAVENSETFRGLKRTHRSFVFPMAALFLVWYFAYVLLAGWAPDFMGQRVWGDITVGLLLGLGQFVTTFAITMGYVAFANRRLDPVAQRIREQLEREEAGR